MDLDFSLLTFSPSQRRLKPSREGKSSSKRTLLQKRLRSAIETKGSVVCEATSASTTNVSSGQEKISRTDLTDGDSVLKSFGVVHHKPTFKSRVSKGKENRGINPSTVNLSSDSGRPNTTNATKFRKNCCRLPCDELREDGSTRKQFSSEVVISGPISNTMDVLASKMNTCESPCAKSYVSCGRYFSCPRNFSKSSSVSSYSSVDETCNKRRGSDDKVNCSVIVVSDSSSSSTSSRDGTPQPQLKYLLSSRTGECKKGLKRVKCITIDTSDSENDVLGSSFEASHKLTLNIRTPLPSDLKFHSCSNSKYEKEGSPDENLELTFSPKPLQLNRTKCRDIENWLSRMKPLKSGYDDADAILEGSSLQKDEVTGNDTKTSVSLNSSAKESPDSLHEATRCKINVDQERPQTEPCKKFSRNEQISRQHTECKKQTVAESDYSTISSTESEEFENFLKNVRQKFESTRRNPVRESPDFIDDEVQDNSLGFYQGLLNGDDLEGDQLHFNGKMNKSRTLRANKKLAFSSSDSDGLTKEHSCDEIHDTSNPRTNVKELRDVEKKKRVKIPVKRIESPVTQIIVKKTPKTVGQTKIKSRVDKQASKFCSPFLTFLASLSADTPNGRCHPEARYYKSDFKKKKEELCKKLFSLYNDKVFDNKLPRDMLVEWNARMKKSAGFCYNRWKVTSPGTKVRSSRIAISTKVCDTADRLRDTLIHEMCHAAVWILNGVKNGHGQLWNDWARKAVQVFPELPPIKRCHNYTIQTKFTYRCTGCGYSIGRHSKSLNVATKRCGYCYGVFELLVNSRRKSGTIAQHAVKSRSPVGFARFVKENYGALKQSRTDIKHADIMRLLGQQFSAMKIVPATRTQ